MSTSTSSGADASASGLRRLLTERELAELLGVSRRTLQGQRLEGRGLPFVRVGRAVRYRRADVEALLATTYSSTWEARRQGA